MATTIPCSRKRKSACSNIFEVDVNDFSPEPSPLPADTENLEPVSKFTKLECSQQSDSGISSGLSQESDILVLSEHISLKQNASQIDEEEGELKDEVDNVEVCDKPQATQHTEPLNVDADKVDQCVMNISFRDESIAKAYRPQFLKFIKSFIELNILSEDDLKISIAKDDTIIPTDWVVIDEVAETPKSKSCKKHKKSKAKKDLFVLDTNPSINTKESQFMRYSSKFSVIEHTEGGEEKNVPVTAQTCFNCNGSHSLKDCPEPKNFEKINAARQKFRNHQNRAARYHLESDQMYGHLVPGKLSEKLRTALGLRKKDLPPYIYKMRMLGYPPGWIEEAQISHSNLSMYDIEGQNVKSNVRKKNGINPEKIVDYPGFNAPIENGEYDDYRFHNVPPFSEDHSKQAMIDYINKMHEDNLEECSMEIDPAEENTSTKCNIPEESSTNKKETCAKDLTLEVEEGAVTVKSEASSDCPISSNNNLKSDDDHGLDTTALDDLESKRKKLLAELGIDSVEGETTENDNTKANGSPKQNMVKKSSFGTPVLKSASPFSTLPKPENFSQDVSPIINFENLPNSTGKYQQMTGVLQKVRTALKSLQSDST